MIIYRTQVINGAAIAIEVADVPVTAKAVHKATLMKEDFIKLVFDSDVDYKFKAGDWVELVQGGMPYILADDYFPSMKDEATFSYELQFNAPWYNLYTTMFLFNTYANGVIVKRESDWYITDTAQNILSLIIRTTQDADRNCPCVFNDVLDCEPTVVKTFTFSSTSILSALNNLAKEFELEWWVTYEGGEYYLHFGECDNSITRDANGAVTFDGSTNVRVRNSALAVELTSGENVTKPSVSQKEGLKKKYYVFGSSRNIDQNAVQDMEAGFFTSIVTKRLELAGNPQVMPEGSGEEVVIFDDIYPRSDYQISGVTPVEIITDEVIAYDEQGNPSEYKRYKVYNLQIEGFSDYIFSLIQNDPNVQNVEDIIASGKPLSLKFITKEMGGQTHTPLLAGFEFELSATLVTDENTGNSWYEFQIQHQDINGYIIPNDNLIPKTGDWVCIFNVKGKYIGGTGSNDGQADLRAAFNKWYANKKRDVSYTIKPYANEDIDLNIGDAVVLNYKDNSVTSRVYSYEKTLDIVLAGLGCSDASYTISSYAKTGSVNQLKEDVKVLTASIANGTAGGSMDASAVQNAIATYGRRLFLSKTTEDAADGHITFKEGITSDKDAHLQRTTFGTFESGFLGSGALIDQYGNAEVKSLYSREFISTPEFRFNRITVTEGEQWNTNGFGVIDEVVKRGQKWFIYLRLEEGDVPSVRYGDFCRGIYSNIGYEDENGTEGYSVVHIGDEDYSIDNQPAYDDCGFPTKNAFFTSYFKVVSDPNYELDENNKKRWYFQFQTKGMQEGYNDPLPCKNMKFAQYGSDYFNDRQSSLYQTSIRHSYIQQLENVNTWYIHSWNIASRYGYLGDLTVTLKNSDGSTYNTTLEGNGLYVQDNVYFGNATIQIDPVTIEDIKRQLANYSIQLSAYTDVIKVDDAGNVIEGLWTDSGEAPDITRNYRIYTVVTARNGITPLTIAEGSAPVGIGKYKIYVQPFGCSCKVENSTIFITHIDNVKDGVAGTEDDVNFDYDACRAMERVWVDVRVDCEGYGTISATMPIAIKHDPVPYIMADLTNENASVSWSSEENAYIGLPVVSEITMAKGNEKLAVERFEVNKINGVTPALTLQPSADIDNPFEYNYMYTNGWTVSVNRRTGEFKVKAMPYSAPAVSEILITCSTTYAGTSYERTLSLHISRFVDTAIWDIIPNHHSVNVDRNAYFNFPYVGVDIFCTDKDGRYSPESLPEGYHLDYRITKVESAYAQVTDPTGNPSEQDWFEIAMPYDAEVAFLQSSGTQYIDTDIIGNQNTKVDAKVMPSVLETMYAYGCRGDNSHSITFCIGSNSSCRFGDQTILYAAAANTLYVVTQDKTKITINGTDYNYGAVTDFVTPASLYLMYSSYDNSTYFFKGKVYYMKIWNGSTLVRDLIPVRVGQVGYMYDKVTGQLFGNAGTGAFTLGSDVGAAPAALGQYVKTNDSSVQSGKTYYRLSYDTIVGNYINLPDPTDEVRVNDPSYADTIKAVEFTLFDRLGFVMDSEEVPILREGTGGQGSTGPAGNGVSGVKDYYLRAKDGFTPHWPNPLGYTPTGDDEDLVETDVTYPTGWRLNTFTAPTKTWPNVWHFTKYEYTSAADYDSKPALITTFSEDGNSIVGIHVYYLRTSESNVNNISRLDQGGTGWLQDEFVEPDKTNGRYVWRYFAFQYAQQINGSYYAYSPIELVAKFVEDGTSFQCAYNVLPAKNAQGLDYQPLLDSYSTGANMPTTNGSSWSATTTGLAVTAGNALWMIQRTYKGTEYGDWSRPVRISGDTGEAGADGTDIEFIYKLSNEIPAPADKPTDFVDDEPWSGTDINGDPYSYDDDDFNPSRINNAVNQDLGWTDNPSGIGWHDLDNDGTEEFYKYEWMCQRTKPKGSAHWGGWTEPSVWSAYGDTGMDGDGVEYVFIRQNNKPATPHGPSFKYNTVYIREWDGKVYLKDGVWLPEGWNEGTFNNWLNGGYNEQGEWIPHTNERISGKPVNEQWKDDPDGVDFTHPKEWVSIRKRISGKWYGFSEPTIWTTYSETPTIVNGCWYVGGDYIYDSEGNPIKAEGENGTGVAIKGRKETFNELLSITPTPKRGDCYIITSTRHLWLYVGDETANHTIVAADWEDMGEFQGANGANSQLHIAWARTMIDGVVNVHRNAQGEITGIDEFVTRYEDLDGSVEYEWIGIATTNSELNPLNEDPSEWDAYKWNHGKGRDGEFYERIFMLTTNPIPPTIDANYTQANFQQPEFRPNVGNVNECGAAASQFFDDPIGTSEFGANNNYQYEWMAERKKVDGVWQAFSDVSLWARYSEDGQGVSRIDTWYLKTTMSVGVTMDSDGGKDGDNWVLNIYLTPDADKPYVWKYSETYVGLGASAVLVNRTPCELISVYSSSPNVNLLDDTAFYSDFALEAWHHTGHVSGDPTADPSNANYNSVAFDNFFGVATGTQGYNSYCGRFKGTAASDAYILLLEQNIIDERVNKIELGKWYTLSYWVKGGNNLSKFGVSIYGHKYISGGGVQTRELIDKSAGVYINGQLISNMASNTNGQTFTYDDGSNSWRKFSTEWRRHVITFKTVASLDADRCFVHWQMFDTLNVHEIYICMPKLEIGMVATTYVDGLTNTKAFPRATEWRAGEQYYAGNIGERYIDMCIDKRVNLGHPAWYKCIRTHISSDANSPTSANADLYWQLASWDGFIATGLILAEKALIQNLVAPSIETGEIRSPHVLMEGEKVQFYGKYPWPSIELKTDDDGVGVLRFYDKNGVALYDLGPNEITRNISQVLSQYYNVYYMKLNASYVIERILTVVISNGGTAGSVTGLQVSDCDTYYKYVEGYSKISSVITYVISGSSTPSAWNGLVFRTKQGDSVLSENSVGDINVLINDGWYTPNRNMMSRFYDVAGNENAIYTVTIVKFQNGAVVDTKELSFKPHQVLLGNYEFTYNGTTYTTLGQVMD